MTEIPFLYHEIGERLLEDASLMSRSPAVLANLYFEKDYFSSQLQAHYPLATVVTKKGDDLLQMQSSSVDWVLSNIALCEYPKAELESLLQAVRRILKPEGLFLFSSFGPGSFTEFNSARLMNVMDMHDVGDQLLAHAFADPVMHAEQIGFSYDDAEDRLDECVALGFTKDLTFVSDTLTLNFEVIYGHAFVPATAAANQAGEVRVPLASVKRRLPK